MVRSVDTVQTRDGAVAINESNTRLSVRSQRRGGKGKNVPNPSGLYNHLKAGPSKKPGDGVHEMFLTIERESPTFNSYFAKENEAKNRFHGEILLYDKNRVILKDNLAPGDYYHASYVDGTEQTRQYVLAQAPFTQETEVDFYRMICQLKPEVVILLMKIEGDDAKFLFPCAKDESKSVAPFTVKVEDVVKEKEKPFVQLAVSISGAKTDAVKVPICIFESWTEDLKVPTSEMADFYNFWRKQVPNYKLKEGSIIVVCPTGAHRCGVWMMYDSEGERLKTKQRIRFTDSAKALRFQRANTLDTQELFDQLIQALAAFAKTVV